MARKKDEERKRGLPPIQLRAAEGASNLVPASWGSPGGSVLTGGNLSGALGLGGKVGVALLLSALGAGAFGVGRMFAPRGLDASVGAQSLSFGRPDASPAMGASMPSAAAPQSAMEIVPESLDGKSDAQRAAEAAKAAAAAQAPAAAVPPPAAGTADADAPPPAADLSAAAQKSPFTEKFGQLSAFGAGHPALNGGVGMSAGVGMQFAQAPLGAPKGFGPTTATASQRLQARAAAVSRPSSHARGFAYNQLARTNGLSRQGAAASGETSSALAGQAFNNSPAAGQAITGGGAGSTPVTGAGTTAAGGPIAQNSQSANDGTSAAPSAHHVNSSPWKMIAMAGVAALALSIVLLGLAHMKRNEAHKVWMTGNHVAAHGIMMMAKILGMIAAALGAIAAGIGLALWQQFHQKAYGGIFMVAGGLAAALGLKILMSHADEKSPGTKVDEATNYVDNLPTTQAPGQGVTGTTVGSDFGDPHPSVPPSGNPLA